MSKIVELDDFEITSDISGIEVEYYAVFFFYSQFKIKLL